MSPQTLIVIMAISILVLAWYANTSKRNKILCTFRRVNKTKIVKFVKMKAQYVIFDGGKYDIVPSRITFQWYTAGIVHMLFPQWVATLDYAYDSSSPLDPNTLSYNWETPRVRQAINAAELVESYFKTSTPSSSVKKQGIFMQYLPFIAIGLVVLVGFWMYNNMQSLSNHMAIIQNQLNAVVK